MPALHKHIPLDRYDTNKVTDRVRYLLECHWGNDRKRMAECLSVPPALLKDFIRGRPIPDRERRDLITAIGKIPRLNRRWIETGDGQPYLMGGLQAAVPESWPVARPKPIRSLQEPPAHAPLQFTTNPTEEPPMPPVPPAPPAAAKAPDAIETFLGVAEAVGGFRKEMTEFSKSITILRDEELPAKVRQIKQDLSALIDDRLRAVAKAIDEAKRESLRPGAAILKVEAAQEKLDEQFGKLARRMIDLERKPASEISLRTKDRVDHLSTLVGTLSRRMEDAEARAAELEKKLGESQGLGELRDRLAMAEARMGRRIIGEAADLARFQYTKESDLPPDVLMPITVWCELPGIHQPILADNSNRSTAGRYLTDAYKAHGRTPLTSSPSNSHAYRVADLRAYLAWLMANWQNRTVESWLAAFAEHLKANPLEP